MVRPPFGEVVILLLIQVGGFGIMTVGALLAVLATRKSGYGFAISLVSVSQAACTGGGPRAAGADGGGPCVR